MPFPFASPDRLLASFRRTGDPRTLGRLFDKTARELLRVAVWLTGNRTDAEDLLQRTFLTVLESRANYDPARRALPWLCGVLGNHARKLQEQRARNSELRPPAGERDPAALAADAEFAAAVARVRAQLGSPYTEVLDLHLAEGLDAKDIATRLGRPAGTVRTQIVRGLALLRRELPRGFVAGLVMTAGVQAASVAAVRAQVMAQASTTAANAAPVAVGAGATVLTFGGIVMGKKLVYLVPALLLVLGGGAFWWQQQSVEAGTSLTPAPGVTAALPANTDPTPASTANAPVAPAERQAAMLANEPVAEPGFATVVVRLRWADDHSPAANVGVLANPEPASILTTREGVTDAQGCLVLSRIRPGPCWITSSFTVSQNLDLAAATVTHVELDATRTGTLTGIVVDAEQRPVVDARLWMSGAGNNPFRGFEIGRSDARGRFSLHFVAMQCLGARKAGFAPSRLVQLTKASREVTLVLSTAGGTIRGRVVDANNKPIPAARIEVGPPGGWVVPGSTIADQLLEPTSAKLIADEKGTFTCDGVAVGTVAVQAWAPGFGPTSTDVQVDAGRSSEVVVMLPTGAVVTGKVFDANGRAVANATVKRVGKYFDFARPRTASEPDGSFRLADLPADSVTLSVDSDVGGLEATLATIAGGLTSWNPVIPTESAPLRGRVVDVDGRPLAKLLVGVLPPGSPHVSWQARTDAEGAFTLKGVEPGTQTLQVELDQACLARREITVPPATALVVTLTADEMPTAHLRGRVVDEAGAGIAATLILRLPSWRFAPATDADVDGTFHRGPLPAGEYLVGLAARGFGTTHLGVVSLRAGEDRALPDVVLRRAGTVDLQLTGGEPTRGNTVQIARRDGVITTWVMPDGNRATAELQPGEYLAVLHSGTSRAAATFVVRSGETISAELAFAPAIALTLTCPREDSTPNDLLQLSVHDAGGTLCDCALLHPGIESAQWRTLLPAGSYTATVRGLDGRTATTAFTVRTGGDNQSFALDLPKH